MSLKEISDAVNVATAFMPLLHIAGRTNYATLNEVFPKGERWLKTFRIANEFSV